MILCIYYRASGLVTLSSSVLPVLLSFFVASWPIGFFITGKVYAFVQKKYLDAVVKHKEQNYRNDEWTDDRNLFQFWFQAELAARFGTNQLFGRKTLNNESIPNMQLVLGRGRLEFPDNQHLIMLSGLYTCYLFGDKLGSYNQMRRVDLSQSTFDTQMHAYVHLELEKKERELCFLQVKGSLDVKLANETAILIKDTKRHHYMSLYYLQCMWKMVLDKSYDSKKLEKISQQLDRSVKKTEAGYTKLISR